MTAVKKRRGRPPGSKNKPKTDATGFVYDQIVQLRHHSDALSTKLDATFDEQRKIIDEMKRVEDAITALKGE